MNIINSLINNRYKIWLILVFSLYVFVMSYVFLHYKNLSPAFDSSVMERPYLIDTEGYKLPDFDPFDKSVLRYLQPSPEIDCNNGKRPLTTGVSGFQDSTSSSSESSSVIIFYEEYIKDYNVNSYYCCYQAIRRTVSKEIDFEVHLDNSAYSYPDAKFFVEKKCHSINSNITYIHEEAVLVQCRTSSGAFYRNIHLFIPVEDTEKNTVKRDNITDKLNVMILGIDSVSRLNLQRYMSKTFAYLKEIALDMKGFNKVFDNTYPNLLSITTGYEYNERNIEKFIANSEGFYDGVPFIWKNFSDAGYKTIYGEDCTSLGTFAYKSKKGFKISPTDYYLRPYMSAVEEILGSNNGHVWISGCKMCGASKLILQHILDYAETVSKTLGKVRPYFSLLWTSSLTHDRLHFAGVADEIISKFLKNMIENSYWNNTIVLFISDHGIRFGSVRETYIGKKEESLPMNYIILPDWFKEKFPTAYENLVCNQDRLTTTRDLHATLVDILNEKYKDERYLKQDHTSYYKASLFRKISNLRSCFTAKIPLTYCAGQVAIPVPVTSIIRLAAKSIISKLNNGLRKFPMCNQLSSFTIKKSYILQFYERKKRSNQTFYEVQMTSQPGDGLLEGLVKIKSNGSTYKPSVVGEISRINGYMNQSICISDINFAKYCYCNIISPVSNYLNYL